MKKCNTDQCSFEFKSSLLLNTTTTVEEIELQNRLFNHIIKSTITPYITNEHTTIGIELSTECLNKTSEVDMNKFLTFIDYVFKMNKNNNNYTGDNHRGNNDKVSPVISCLLVATNCYTYKYASDIFRRLSKHPHLNLIATDLLRAHPTKPGYLYTNSTYFASKKLIE